MYVSEVEKLGEKLTTYYLCKMRQVTVYVSTGKEGCLIIMTSNSNNNNSNKFCQQISRHILWPVLNYRCIQISIYI